MDKQRSAVAGESTQFLRLERAIVKTKKHYSDASSFSAFSFTEKQKSNKETIYESIKNYRKLLCGVFVRHKRLRHYRVYLLSLFRERYDDRRKQYRQSGRLGRAGHYQIGRFDGRRKRRTQRPLLSRSQLLQQRQRQRNTVAGTQNELFYDSQSYVCGLPLYGYAVSGRL